MDDTAYREFFKQPTQTYHHRYEALRAVFVDQRSQKEVAEEFGFTYGSMRQLVFEFRQYCDTQDEPTESPFFEMSMSDVPSRVTTTAPIHLYPIDANSFYRIANRCVSEQERQACSCSCLCWLSWGSTSWCSRPAIRGRRWSLPMRLC